MTKYTLIYNPTAGHRHGANVADIAAARLTKAGHAVTLSATSDSQDAAALAEAALADVVVAVGGDGTVNQVAKGLLRRRQPPVLGLLPAGTVNNLARSLQLPLDPFGATRVLATGTPQPLDIGTMNGAVMVSTLTLGVLANAAVAVTQSDKQRFGAAAFLVKGWASLARHQHWELTLHAPGHDWVKDTEFMLVTMTNAVGGFTNFAPDAKPGDGLFHVFVAPRLTWGHVAMAAPYFLSGQFSQLPGMTYFTTPSLDITAKKHLRTRIDGDPSVRLPLQLRIRQLRVLAPGK